jgi:hypothetical protein
LWNVSAAASTKHRRLKDKENVSPHSVIASVVERPAELGSSILGKRHSSGQLPEEMALKKGKIELLTPLAQSTGVDCEQKVRVDVEFRRVADPSCSDVLTRKRKRVFMDAVEVPTWQEVNNKRRATKLLKRSPFSPSQSKTLPDRRTQPITSADHGNPNKKRSSSAPAKDVFSSSLRALEEIIEIAGSGKQNSHFAEPR